MGGVEEAGGPAGEELLALTSEDRKSKPGPADQPLQNHVGGLLPSGNAVPVLPDGMTQPSPRWGLNICQTPAWCSVTVRPSTRLPSAFWGTGPELGTPLALGQDGPHQQCVPSLGALCKYFLFSTCPILRKL